MSGPIEVDDGLKPVAQRSPSSPVDGLKQSKHFNPQSKSLGGMIANLDDGTGELDPDAVVSTLKQHAKARRSNIQLKKTIAALAGLYVITVLAMLATSTAGALIAKDTKTDSSSGVQTTKEGVPVKTEIAAYYADIMKLPEFGLDQLDHLQSISIASDSGVMNFKAAGFRAESSMLTIYTTADAKITINTDLGKAQVVMGLEPNTVTIDALTGPRQDSTRRLLSEEEQQSAKCTASGACLYTRPDMIHQHAGRQLSAGEKRHLSYATLSTANLGSLEALSSLLESISPSQDYYMGTAHAYGVSIKFSKNKDNGLRLSLDVAGQTHLFANAQGDDASFTFEAGALVKCSDDSNVLSNAELSALLSGDGEVYVTIDEKYDGVSDNGFMFSTPTQDECLQVLTNGGSNRRRLLSTEDDEFVSEGHRHMGFYRDLLRHWHKTPELQHHLEIAGESNNRQLLGENVDRTTAYHFGEMSADVYDGPCNGRSYGSWSCVGPIQNGNAYANKFVRTVNGERQCAYVFRGSNDFSDWVSNILGVVSSWSKVCSSGQDAHRGFVNEFNDLKAQIDADTNCGKYYFSGHSLGGAMASIADVCYGNSKSTSVTFAAPKVFRNSLTTTEYRLFHESDPVSGKVFGTMSSFQHSGGNPSRMIYCNSRNWWGSCRGYGVKNVCAQCDSGTWDTDFGAHGIDKVKSYI